MAKQTYKQTHRCLGSTGVGPVTVEGAVLDSATGRRRWVNIETRHGIVQVWVDVDAIIRRLGARAMRSQSGVAKTISGAVQVRAVDIKRTPVVQS